MIQEKGKMDRGNFVQVLLDGLLYVYFCEIDRAFNVDLEFAEDGHEHSECGWFGLDNLPSPIGEQLKKIILKKLSYES